MAKALPVTDKSAKNGTLSVNLDEILAELVEQRHFKKIVFHIKNQRNALQIQSKTDRLCSAFHLIQEENGTFFKPFLSIQALKASCGNNSANQAQDASLCTDQHRQAVGFV